MLRARVLLKSVENSGKTVLRPPRAVTKAEADSIQPARSSNTTSMMPWRGWWDRFLQERLSAETYAKYRETFFFMPDDIYDGQQAPKATQKIPISKTDPSITHMYRYPAPGSQTPTVQPEFEASDDPYDIGYFKKDTRRRYLHSEGNTEVEMAKLDLMEDSETVQEQKEALQSGPESSPGNAGRFATGPTDFDSTGLRATMSANWESLNASLDAHMPDHLPTPTWVGYESEITEYYESRNLPVPVGGYYAALKVPVERRVARW